MVAFAGIAESTVGNAGPATSLLASVLGLGTEMAAASILTNVAETVVTPSQAPAVTQTQKMTIPSMMN